jgi:hypothetical protein
VRLRLFITERLDPSLHLGVKKVLRQAWDSASAERAERVLKILDLTCILMP